MLLTMASKVMQMHNVRLVFQLLLLYYKILRKRNCTYHKDARLRQRPQNKKDFQIIRNYRVNHQALPTVG